MHGRLQTENIFNSLCSYIITFKLLNYRYDYNLKIFYFCDIKPLTNSLQCYKYVAESKIVSLGCTTRIE